jgi:hypothetical protein
MLKCKLYSKDGTFLGETSIDQSPENYNAGSVLQWKDNIYHPTGVDTSSEDNALKFEEVDVLEIQESDFTSFDKIEQSLEQEA